MTTEARNWWKTGVCYQVWPASYKDSNGDGIGDIPGIISKLDYIASLGVDILWLSPMYASPQEDMGYDVSDYEDIYPPYGTMDDMDKLIDGCHVRGIKMVLDLVINHTSDQHAWFKESRKSKTGKYADHYIWKDPKLVDGKRQPPNNWLSCLGGGSAWKYSEERDQYYLHMFTTGMPDLNWEIKEVRKAIYDSAIEYWLKKGVDGFRVDVVNFYSKDTAYPDAPIVLEGEYQPALQFVVNGPRMHEWLQEIRTEVLDRYGDIVMIGEADTSDPAETMKYISTASRELNMVFDSEVMMLSDRMNTPNWHQLTRHKLSEFKQVLRGAQRFVTDTEAWTSVFLENHDQSRSLSRYATDEDQFREQAAKVLAMLLTTLSGTLFIYQGQEIGMVNVPADWTIDDMKDVATHIYYKEALEQFGDDPVWQRKIMKAVSRWARDNARTPVQWDSSAHAGFSTAEPWIRVHPKYPGINVADQDTRPDSPLNFWRQMLRIRKQYPDLTVFGKFEVWDLKDPDVFVFTKTDVMGNHLLVYLNFSGLEQPMFWKAGWKDRQKQLVVSNVDDARDSLMPWEGRVYHVPA